MTEQMPAGLTEREQRWWREGLRPHADGGWTNGPTESVQPTEPMTPADAYRPAHLRRPGLIPDITPDEDELATLRAQRAAVLELCERADQTDDAALLAFVVEVRTALAWIGDDPGRTVYDGPHAPLWDGRMAGDPP